MKLVSLVSGGIDSTLMSVLASEQQFQLFPLYINYGQLAYKREWSACQKVHTLLKLPKPNKVNVQGFGKSIQSGLTTSKMRIREDAFLPGRNSLFLLIAASYAYRVGANNVAIGLLTDKNRLFPDQSKAFIETAEKFINAELDFEIKILTPLMNFNKAEVIELCRAKNITNTYSCHSGNQKPCGKCISCIEINNAHKILKKNNNGRRRK